MSDLARDPADEGGAGDDAELDQLDELDTEIEDEPEPDEGPEPEGGEETEPEPRQTRRGPRGRANGEEIRELRTQLEHTNRQLEELRRPAPQRIDPAAQQAAEVQFWANLEMMPPGEAYRTLYSRARQEFGQQFAQQQLNTQESLDKQQYDAQARSDPLYQKYRADVEALVAAERQRGNFVSREIALNQVYAQDMRNRAKRVAGPQRRAGAARLAAQTVRTPSGRGDVARGGTRRNQDADDADMLRGITAGDI